MKRSLIFKSQSIMDVLLADTFKKRLFGYMFQRRPKHDAILFSPCNSIHTYFMLFNIDVLFISREMRIIKKIENLGQNKVIMPVRNAVFVIEAKTGSFQEIKEGELIDFK